MGKLKVAVLGATGTVGQKFIQILQNHPWFEVSEVAASDRSVGKPYREAARWLMPEEIPESIAGLIVKPPEPTSVKNVDLVFSALPSDVAGKVELAFAQKGYYVFSNASSHRMEPDVPLLNPEVNSAHISLIEEQRRARRWDGAIVTNPNCTAAILTLSLKPISDLFGIDGVIVTSMQALSGAGYPGVPSLEITDNVIPYIKNEEEKVQSETLKMLGSPEKSANFKVSASCNRVATLDGHLEAVFVKTERAAAVEELKKAMAGFTAEPQRLRLPTAPERPVFVRPEEDRPQPRIDRMAGGGMSVVVGRLRPEEAFGGVKYLVLGHNTIRGAAGCSVLNAELARAKGYL